jgi:hypothetical protein
MPVGAAGVSSVQELAMVMKMVMKLSPGSCDLETSRDLHTVVVRASGQPAGL